MLIALYILGLLPSYFFLVETDLRQPLVILFTLIWPLTTVLIILLLFFRLIQLILTGKI